MTNTVARSPKQRAFLAVALSSLGYTIMMLAAKKLSHDWPQTALISVRSLINLIITTGAILLWQRPLQIPITPLLLFRGMMGALTAFALFTSLTLLPIGIAATLNWGSPIFVLFFAPWMGEEHYSKRAYFWVLLAILGVWFLVGYDHHDSATTISTAGLLIGLFGAMTAALSFLSMRKASQTHSVRIIVFYFNVTASLFALPLMVADLTRNPVELKLIDTGYFLVMGIGASIASFALTHAYRLAPAGFVSTANLGTAALTALAGATLLGEWMSPLQWFGLLVMAFAIWRMAMESKTS